MVPEGWGNRLKKGDGYTFTLRKPYGPHFQSMNALKLDLVLQRTHFFKGLCVLTRYRRDAKCFTFVILFKYLHDSCRQKLTLILFHK